MTGKENLTRRGFIKGTTQTAVGAVLATKAATVGRNVLGANDRINIAVVGIRGRGRAHISSFAAIPNVRIATLCDIDENLFPLGPRQRRVPGQDQIFWRSLRARLCSEHAQHPDEHLRVLGRDDPRICDSRAIHQRRG